MNSEQITITIKNNAESGKSVKNYSIEINSNTLSNGGELEILEKIISQLKLILNS